LKLKLGVNCGFAINRYPETEVWTKIVGEELGLRYVQFVADVLSPFWSDDIVNPEIARIRRYCKRYDITIPATFSSAFTRVNHVMHPRKAVREYYIRWYKRYFRMSRKLGAVTSGSHFGIMSMRDYLDVKRRRRITRIGIGNWQRLALYAKKIGMKYLIFEPMSVPREMAETIDETEKLYSRVNRGAAIPILLCLDVDHGDVQSKNPADTDPYAWLEAFGARSPFVHIKQSLRDKGGHWPFTKEYNRRGRIKPEKVIRALEKSGAEDVTLLFEFSHRERYPTDYTVVKDLKESVGYWRRYVKE